MPDFTPQEKLFLINVLAGLTVKPTAPDAVETVKIIQSISDKLK